MSDALEENHVLGIKLLVRLETEPTVAIPSNK
jgi:hypothetical protein